MANEESGADQAAGDEVDDVSNLPPEPMLLQVRSIPGEISDTSVRARLAYLLVAIYGGTIILSFIIVGFCASNDVHQMIENLIAAETGLFGTVLGFYFGGKANQA